MFVPGISWRERDLGLPSLPFFVVGRVRPSPSPLFRGRYPASMAVCVGLRFWVWQGLDGRPQLIDQRPAVADLLPLFDIGQSIPQCQEPLAAERSGV
jgi:hypothetical protein